MMFGEELLIGWEDSVKQWRKIDVTDAEELM
jgi:hypothetical protein